MVEDQKKVQVWIHVFHPKEKKIYFLLLLTRPERGAFWQPVTGSVEVGETLKVAALREAKEETGLPFSRQPVAIGKGFEFESRGRHVKEYGFSLETEVLDQIESELPKVTLDAHEHTEYRWVLASQAAQMVRYSSNSKILALVVEGLDPAIREK